MKRFSLFIILILFITHVHATQVGNQCTEETAYAQCGELLVCRNNTCQYCIEDEECTSLYVCQKFEEQPHGVCTHKNLFPQFSLFDGLSSVICFIGAMLAATSGVGGGGIFIPTCQFSPQLAAALSTVTIFGGSIANWSMFGRQKHPNANRPLIDYTVCLLVEPMILIGVTIGVFFNIMFPSWLTIVLMVSLLSVTAYRSIRKGITKFKQETKELKQKKQREEDSKLPASPTSPTSPVSINSDELSKIEMQSHQEYDEQEEKQEILSPKPSVDDVPYSPESTDQDKDDLTHQEDIESHREPLHTTEQPEKVKKILKREARMLPWDILLLLILGWAIMFGFALLKGGKGAKSIINVPECSWMYWMIVVGMVPALLPISFIAAFLLRRSYHQRKKLNMPAVKGDIDWNIKNIIRVGLISCLSGVAGGLLGIGGGMLTVPMLLELGVLTQVATSTSALMIFFTSSATVVQYAIIGVLPIDYALWFGAIGLTASFIGQLVVERLVKKYNRTSWIIFILAITISVSTACMAIIGIYNLVQDILQGAWTSLKFKPPC